MDGGFWANGLMMGVCFLLIIWRHHAIHAPVLWLAVFLDSWLKYAFLEPFIEFLAFLVQKLCQKYSKHVRNFPMTSRGFPILIFYHFFHNSSTRNAIKSIKPSKTSYYSLECIWISRGFEPLILLDSRTPTGRWRHGLFRETCQNNLWFCKHSQKGRNRTTKRFFFSLNYKSFPIQTGFEQLSSLIRWRVMAI